jgi:hypothetical protein
MKHDLYFCPLGEPRGDRRGGSLQCLQSKAQRLKATHRQVAVVGLASNDSSYVTGAELFDGGFSQV